MSRPDIVPAGRLRFTVERSAYARRPRSAPRVRPGDVVAMSAVTAPRTGRLRRRTIESGRIMHGLVYAVAADGTLTCTGEYPQWQPETTHRFVAVIPQTWFMDAGLFLDEVTARTWTVEDLDEGAPLNLLLHRHVLPEHTAEVIPE